MDLVLGVVEVSTFAVCAHSFHGWHKKQQKLQALIAFIQKCAVFTPSGLARAMSPGASESLSRSIGQLEEGNTFARGVALVQGIVCSEQMLRSILNHSSRLVMSTLSSEQLLSDSRTFEETETKALHRSVSEFKLKDHTSNTANLTITNFSNTNFKDAMHTVQTVEHSRDLTPLEHFLNWILFCFRLFLSMSNVGKKLSGFRVGTRRIERGILVGQFLIAFGEVVFDRVGKQLVMTNPEYFMQDKEQFLQYLREQNTKLGRNMTLVMSLMVIFGIFILKRLYVTVKTKITKMIREKQSKDKDKFVGVRRLTANTFKCMVCNTNPRSVVFKPCLHLAVCWLCESKLDEHQCPQCGQEIEESVNIYIA